MVARLREGGYTEVVTLMGGRMVMLQRWSLMEGEWSCYTGGQFKGGRIFMLHFNGRENGDVTEVVFNGGSMVMLQRRSV